MFRVVIRVGVIFYGKGCAFCYTTHMSDYTAIIPAAGKGVRLLPFTQHCPKTMLSVAGKPIIAHILEQIEACGIRKAVFVVGYQKQALIDYVRSHYPHLQSVFVEQAEPKGLGHAVYMAKNAVKGPCLIVLSDTIIDGDLRPLVQSGRNAVGVKPVEDPRRFGVVEMKEGKITGFEEKPDHPKSNLALIGAYSFLEAGQLFSCLEEVIASGKTVKNEIQLTDALSCLLKRGADIVPVEMDDWFDCGTVEIMLQTNRILLQRHSHVPQKFSRDNRITPPCWIDESARLENCVLGPYVSVGEGAELTDCRLEDAIIAPQTHVNGLQKTHFMLDKDSK